MKGKIFNAQEMQSILNGSKTMFREVIKVQPKTNISSNMISFAEKLLAWSGGSKCPYQVGQKIKPKPKSGSIDLQLKLFNTELLIKEIRVERLVDIEINDLKKEGLPEKYDATCPASWFAKLWNATHKKPEHKFEASPWVWVVEFEVINN